MTAISQINFLNFYYLVRLLVKFSHLYTVHAQGWSSQTKKSGAYQSIPIILKFEFSIQFLGVKQCWSPKTFFLTKSYFKRLCWRHYLSGRWKVEELTAYQLWQILHLCEFQAFEKHGIKNKIPQNFPSTHHRIHILSIILFMVVMWLGSGVVNEHWNIKNMGMSNDMYLRNNPE